jgi:hypothetical protein
MVAGPALGHVILRSMYRPDYPALPKGQQPLAVSQPDPG